MKEYFIEKLTKSMRAIRTTEKHIIEAATKMEMSSLLKLPLRLQEEKERHSEWITDLCTYCTVDEVIEISNLKDKYSNETLNLLDSYRLEYFYKYNNKGITISEKDKLVERFGYSLKEAKVK